MSEQFGEDFEVYKTVNVNVSPDDAIARMKYDPEFVIYLAAPEIMLSSIHGVPEFHTKCLGEMLYDPHEFQSWILPRNHAKTFLLKIGTATKLRMRDRLFAAYVSNTSPLAENFTRSVWKTFNCKNYTNLFGHIDCEIERDGLAHYEFTQRKFGQKQVLKAFGSGQQTRGMNIDDLRPDLIVCDDVETRETVASETEQAKLQTWVMTTLFKAGNAKRCQYFWAANLLSKKSLTYDIGFLSPRWKSRVYSAITANGEVLWKELYTLERLLAEYQEYARIGQGENWIAELMNVIEAANGTFWVPANITFGSPKAPDALKAVCLALDPSSGTGKDDAAIVVHGLTNEGYWQSVDYYFDNSTSPIKIVNKAIELALKWRTGIIGVESVGMQSTYLSLFELQLNTLGITGFEIVKLTTRNQSKASRILAWRDLVMKGTYHLTSGDTAVLHQASEYEMLRDDNRDDLLDAHASIIEMSERYLGQILEYRKRGTQIEEQSAQFGCSVF